MILLQQEGFDCINGLLVPLCGVLSEGSLFRRAENLQWSERTRSRDSNKLVDQQHSLSPPPDFTEPNYMCWSCVVWSQNELEKKELTALYHMYTICSVGNAHPDLL